MNKSIPNMITVLCVIISNSVYRWSESSHGIFGHGKRNVDVFKMFTPEFYSISSVPPKGPKFDPLKTHKI